MLDILFIIFFTVKYWNHETPPIYDLILPATTIYTATYYQGSFFYSLIFDAFADFLMNTENISLSIILFSFAHLLKQHHCDNWLLIAINCLLVSVIVYINLIKDKRFDNKIIGDTKNITICLYSILLVNTFIIKSLHTSSINFSYILYIISDAIIAYEMAIGTIYPRQLRIIGVPVLYWLSQYILE